MPPILERQSSGLEEVSRARSGDGAPAAVHSSSEFTETSFRWVALGQYFGQTGLGVFGRPWFRHREGFLISGYTPIFVRLLSTSGCRLDLALGFPWEDFVCDSLQHHRANLDYQSERVPLWF